MSTIHFPTSARPMIRQSASRQEHGVLARAARAWRAWLVARHTAFTGRYLTQMDDHMLKDIGISRAQAMFMASRPELGVHWHDDAR